VEIVTLLCSDMTMSSDIYGFRVQVVAVAVWCTDRTMSSESQLLKWGSEIGIGEFRVL